MNYSLHSHTPFCHHAQGTPEEYVQQAIKIGLSTFGFSDHAPFKVEGHEESGFRICTDDFPKYIDTILTLKEKYKDYIDVRLGLECEYFPDYFESQLEYYKKMGIEYLICGQHFTDCEYFECAACGFATEDINILKKYTDRVISAIKSGKFTYICHPDLINYTGDDEYYDGFVRDICLASVEYDTPLELNGLGIREGRHYPTDKFWSRVSQYNPDVAFGLDAHTTAHAGDLNSYYDAVLWAKKYNLNLKNTINIKNI